jgi:formyl-CoA transferase
LGELLCERSGFRLSDNPGGIDTPGPNLGEHNAEVLGETLGLSPEEIERLVTEDVVS